MQCGNGDTCVFDLTKQIGTFIVTKVILDNVLEHFVPYVLLRFGSALCQQCVVSDPIFSHVQMGRPPCGVLLREEAQARGEARAVAGGISRRRVHVGRVFLRVSRTGCVLL